MLQEITSIYHVLSPPTLTQEASNRVCNALSLLQVLEEWGVGEPVEDLVGLRLGAYLQPNKGHDSLVAIFIVQKILSDDEGLKYICATAERFFARLSDNPRACDALRNCLPDMLRDGTFDAYLRLTNVSSWPSILPDHLIGTHLLMTIDYHLHDQINFSKSSLILINVEADRIQVMANIMGSRTEALPCRYLGLPLRKIGSGSGNQLLIAWNAGSKDGKGGCSLRESKKNGGLGWA
ncbi:hypothetical protein QJS10_CPB22g00193 [Acorus calamus]|uniref:Uncharacterized protein n=1 Tax=Acorus calamus TaxID=4465 RepID=A0AAV9C366_ACOCL|nr:hypothetical protein QJS10_CPB22g00193 [Acorus calamus]